MGNANSYLYLSRHNIYYFRVIVPIGVTGDVTNQEYRKSLQTRNPKTARKRCVALRACLEELYDGKRCVMVGWSELRKILDDKLLQLIAIEQDYVEKSGPRSPAIEEIWLQEDLPRYLQEIEDISNSPDHADLPLVVSGAKADAILKEHNIDLSDSHDLFVKFCESLLYMYIEYNSKRIEINKNARTFAPHPSTAKPSFTSQTITEPESTDYLSKVIDEFCDEKVDAGNWTDKTHKENRTAFNLLLEVVHDMPIADVDSQIARYFKRTLRKLPSNRKKKAQYRDKSIKQLQAMKIPSEDRLSVSKVNSHLGKISSFLKWAVTHGYVDRNVFFGLRIKDTTPDHEKRVPFTDSDLQILFSTPEFQEGKRLHPHYYWLPLIGLYSGARIEEICQLELNDIYESDGIWIFDIIDTPDDKKTVKTEASKRKVPVHSRLVDLGLFRFVEQLKKKEKKRLFPELKKRGGKYSSNPSRWFGRYRRRIGVTHPKKPFHSFRHTVVNHLKQKGVAKELIAAIVGHKDDSITTGVYGEPYKPASVAPIVEKLEFSVDVPAYF